MSLYTSISARIPEKLTAPTASFKKHVWLSVFGLLCFIGLYLALTIWFASLCYNLFVDANQFDGHFFNYLLAIGFGFLSLFMAKSLFFLNKREENPIHLYLNQKDEPLLFDYLYKLADEAGAPRPHKVFLTDRVNASVSYDISLVNLIFPSKKNLEIGLGLVNVLSLGEFKAVLAHEFGHFAQRSMLLGRYVYVAQQIAARIVGKRDGFDSFLAGLSSIDIRIAWIGWILSILVWCIRSLVETCFSVVVVAERALSREMEFQADLVAVSLTGSDALIHALYKLQIADEAYNNTLECLTENLGEKKAVKNMYALQTNYIENMASVLDEETYGKSPVVPKHSPEAHRIFTSKKYNPPAMWSTHPADVDRENNAKRTYIYEPIDEKSSWDLFSDPMRYKEEMTKRLISTAKVNTELLTNEEALKAQENEYFNWTFLKSKYHSAFFNRNAFLNFKTSDELYQTQIRSNDLEKVFKELYPKELVNKINLLQEVKEEIAALIISKNEALTVEKRQIWHRGDQIKRKDIPNILESLKNEVHALQEELGTHDKKCRVAHYKASETLGGNWSSYLKNLTNLVHYSEHSMANINDVARKFNNVLAIALADGRVSSSEMTEILNSGFDYQNVLRKVYQHSNHITLDATLLKNMKVENYQDAFEEFKLPPPDEQNINDWVNVVDGWSSVALKALSKLRNEALELLLESEEKVKRAFLNNTVIEPVSNVLKVPVEYDTLVPGTEREIQQKLGLWDRFFVGDGLIPSLAKLIVSGGILFAAIYYGSYSQKLPVHIYNGLQTPVTVTIDGETIYLSANSSDKLQLNYGKSIHVETNTQDNVPIETLDVKINEHATYIYNIANAAAFIKYPVYYGYEGAEDVSFLGAEQWFPVTADYVIKEPPASISLSSTSKGERKFAVQAYSDIATEDILSIVENENDYKKMIASHGKWDNSSSKNILTWMYYLREIDNGLDIVETRLSRSPNDVVSLRAMQDISKDSIHDAICLNHKNLANSNPDNADLFYLATRCIEDEEVQDNTFIEGHKKWKNHNWLAYASAGTYIERGDFEAAFNAYEVAAKNNENLADIVALSSERVKRLINKTNPKSQYETLIYNDDIRYYNTLESGEIEGKEKNPNYIYYLIHQGKLDEAFALSLKFEEIKTYTQSLIAASNGATKDMKTALLNKSSTVDGINLNSVWSVLGLAVKNNENYDDYLPVFEPLELQDNFIDDLINLIKTRQFNKVEKHVSELGLRWKAQAYTLASIILEEKTPAKWKQIADAVLFANEKPFIK